MTIIAKLYAAGAGLVLVLLGVWWVVHSLEARGAAQCKADVAAAVAKSQLEAAATEAAWKEKLDAVSKDRQAQIDNLATSRAALLAQLRKRPERRADVPGVPIASCAGSTGAELARPDGEFLGRYAAFARSIQLELGACQAREAVNAPVPSIGLGKLRLGG